jgi:hypothetical protein
LQKNDKINFVIWQKIQLLKLPKLNFYIVCALREHQLINYSAHVVHEGVVVTPTVVWSYDYAAIIIFKTIFDAIIIMI